MFAIVDIAGQQFKVEKGKSYFVHRLPNETGANVSFDKVLLLYNENDIRVGTPLLEGITIDAQVLEHLKGEKVVVFKKKRRKGYRVKNGHRQCFTKILVEDIILGEVAPKKKAAEKKEIVVEQPVEVEAMVKDIAIEEIVPQKKAATKKPVVDEQFTEVETAPEAIAVDEVAPKKKAATKKPAAKKAVAEEQPAEENAVTENPVE
jgi:large subunit ribosomal protein L21